MPNFADDPRFEITAISKRGSFLFDQDVIFGLTTGK